MKKYFVLLSQRPLPDWVTLVGIIPFLLSMLMISHGKPILALLFSIINFFIDSIDGLIARKTKTSSEFGRQLDSCVDVLIYLVFPAFFVINFLNANSVLTFIAAALIIAFGILRLIRFNLAGFVYREDQRYYSGLGTAYILLTVNLLFIANYWLGTIIDWATPLILLVMSWLMVSEVPMRKPKLAFWYPVVAIIVITLLAIYFGWI
jgi:CDP-diacylglycerol--serine O-phosphatidyltransferase